MYIIYTYRGAAVTPRPRSRCPNTPLKLKHCRTISTVHRNDMKLRETVAGLAWFTVYKSRLLITTSIDHIMHPLPM